MLTREAAAELASGNRPFLFYLSLASHRGPTRICGHGAMRIFSRRAPTNWHFYCHCLKLTQGGERSYWRGSPAAGQQQQLQQHNFKVTNLLPDYLATGHLAAAGQGGKINYLYSEVFLNTVIWHLTITVKCEWHTEAKINSLMAEHEEWWLIRYIFTEERSRDWAIPRKYSLEIRVL